MHAIAVSLVLIAACGGASPPSHKPNQDSAPCGEPCPSGQSCQQADTCQDQPDGTRRCMGLVYTCQPDPSP
jgi:hypothetical protein